MKRDPIEDFKDLRDIRRQKADLETSGEEMAKWNFGKGTIQNKDVEKDVRNSIQQESR